MSADNYFTTDSKCSFTTPTDWVDIFSRKDYSSKFSGKFDNSVSYKLKTTCPSFAKKGSREQRFN